MPVNKGDYECLSCGCKYEASSGPTVCPLCGSLYIKWINSELFNMNRKKSLDK